MTDVFLFYVSYEQQLQLFHLVLVYEKEVVFVPKSGKIVVKVNRVTSWYKEDTPTPKSDMSQKKKIRIRERYCLNLFVEYY